ncbi:MAG TPA: proteasome accessory factor PafA2 family protein, partial [Cellulomonadaceae bacterium]|nr:proteasome accessory factor PafA2 family protein [Cellulomonadaceae bacterium]
MTVRRVMGIETEYGIAEPGHPMANPMLLSSYVVAAYAGTQLHRAARARWDYDDEDPLQDARGFHLDRASAHPSVLTDDPAHPAPSGDATPEDVPARRRPGAPQSRPRLPVEEYEDPGVANVILTNGARLYVDHAHPEYSSP